MPPGGEWVGGETDSTCRPHRLGDLERRPVGVGNFVRDAERKIVPFVGADLDAVTATSSSILSSLILSTNGQRRRVGGHRAAGTSGRGDRWRFAMADTVTIDQALDAFLRDQRARLSDRTYRNCDDVIRLLRDSLNRYAYSSLDARDAKRWQKAFDAGDEDAFCKLFGPAEIPPHLGEFLGYSWSAR